ncbi:hypothetical protein HanIR_Chr09g0416181 [Helianthus annuus]|nr:hypothetical protein HanIR_Chr09g0416181 [Helianthus annuus]
MDEMILREWNGFWNERFHSTDHQTLFSSFLLNDPFHSTFHSCITSATKILHVTSFKP